MVKQTCRGAATPSLLRLVHDTLSSFVAACAPYMGQPGAAQLGSGFATAVVEVSTNIIRHAYPPKAPGQMILHLWLYADRVEATFEDMGSLFVPAEVALSLEDTLGDDLTQFPEGGFGLQIAHASVDVVEYTRRDDEVNQWRLIKWHHDTPDDATTQDPPSAA